MRIQYKCLDFIFSVIATTNLTLVSRNVTSLVVQFVPQEGVSGYEIRARSPVKGAFTRSCNTQSRTCELTGLPFGTDYTLWLQSCEVPKHFRLCYLRAMEFQTYTPLQGETLEYLFIFCAVFKARLTAFSLKRSNKPVNHSSVGDIVESYLCCSKRKPKWDSLQSFN